MPDFRAHCPAPAGSTGVLSLTAAESHHLVTVNRARIGDPVVIFDGAGQEWDTRLLTADRRGATVEIITARPATRLPCRITLAQALPKGGVMDDIVRHATEIGAHRIVPVITARTQVHLTGERQEKKRDKWQSAALEAAKQCGNPWLPIIEAPTPLAELWPDFRQADLALVASLHPGAQRLATVVQARLQTGAPPRSVIWLVGPEGDLTADEVAAAIEAGALPVSLGPLVLRCDTAATYALAVLSAAFNP